MAEQNDEDYEKKMRKRYEAAMKSAQQEMQKKEIAKNLLDDKAYERLMNIRVSNQDLYNQVISILISLAQQQKVAGKVTERQLIALLERMTAKREPTIEYKHK